MMKENELQINENGIWLKTNPENVEGWKACITDFFKLNGFRFLTSNQQTESVHVTLQKANESIILNFFTDGRIQLTYKDINALLEKFVPQMENSLDVKFEHILDEDDDGDGGGHAPSVIKIIEAKPIIIKEERVRITPPISNAEKKTENSPSSRSPRISAAGRQVINRNERRFINLSIQHEELIKIKLTLTSTEDELTSLRTDVTKLRDEFNSFKKELFEATWSKENLILQNMKDSNAAFMKTVRREIAGHVTEMKDRKEEGNAKIYKLEAKIRENKLSLLKMTMEKDEIDFTGENEGGEQGNMTIEQ